MTVWGLGCWTSRRSLVCGAHVASRSFWWAERLGGMLIPRGSRWPLGQASCGFPTALPVVPSPGPPPCLLQPQLPSCCVSSALPEGPFEWDSSPPLLVLCVLSPRGTPRGRAWAQTRASHGAGTGTQAGFWPHRVTLTSPCSVQAG